MYLPSEAELKNETVGDLANRLYPTETFDCALPQSWVDTMLNRGFNPCGQVVWGYPKGSMYGVPMPLTWESAVKMFAIIAYTR